MHCPHCGSSHTRYQGGKERGTQFCDYWLCLECEGYFYGDCAEDDPVISEQESLDQERD